MILYTIMPQEAVFPTPESEFAKQKIINHNGVSLLVNELSTFEYQVVRILSSDPQHFLDSRYTPGQSLQFDQTFI
ncbi:YlzJ-like family protein [Bacillus timonensis]|nr:YlzJ-like family protein [Bacillus timonensis]